MKGGLVMDRVGTLKLAAQWNGGTITCQARTLEVSGALRKLGIMETGMNVGSQPEVGKGTWAWV